MSHLCDTQILMWMAAAPQKLPKDAARIIVNESAQLYFSQVSIWEVSIKFALNRNDFIMDPKLLASELMKRGLLQLPILNDHIYASGRLPHIHRDPFDRLLVAQAQTEGITLMTTDKTLAKYGNWVQRF